MMLPTPLPCTPDVDLRTVARLLIEADASVLTVIDGDDTRRPVGLIGSTDVTSGILENDVGLVARDVMGSVTTIDGDISATEARVLAERQGASHLVVVDAEGRYAGILPRECLDEDTRSKVSDRA